MSETEWRLLTTLPDLPTAELLAGILAAEGIAVRVMSEAGVLGAAAPSRLYVCATQLPHARHSLAQRELSDEELGRLAAAAQPAEEL